MKTNSLLQSISERTLPLHDVEAPVCRLPVRTLAFAFPLGLFGTLLFRGQTLGINLAAGTALLAGAGLFLERSMRRAGPFHRPTYWLALLISAGCLAWRDSATLNGLAFGLLLALVALGVTPEPPRLWRTITMSRAVVIFYETFAHLLGGCLQLAGREITWNSVPRRPLWGSLYSLSVGLLASLPFAMVFLVLFSSADAIYKDQLLRLTHFDGWELFTFVVWLVGLTWLATGYLRRISLPAEVKAAQPPPLSRGLGAAEINVALAVINLIFLSFVLVQLRYLFGGDQIVQVTPSLTYAEYARRGFFELVAVAALVLPLLLLADWMHPRNQRRAGLRILSLTLIALLLVIMLSAARRMQLYQAEYGLTELRFYVSAFILLLACLFAWFIATVCRGRRELFLSGAFSLGAAAILLLHLVNPDGWIMRVNARRAAQGLTFDAAHAARLSTDSWPALLAELHHLPPDSRAEMIAAMRARKLPDDPREWNWSRWSASRLDLPPPTVSP